MARGIAEGVGSSEVIRVDMEARTARPRMARTWAQLQHCKKPRFLPILMQADGLFAVGLSFLFLYLVC